MHDMCNWEIDLEIFTSQDTYRTTKFLKRIRGNICGLIQPISGPFMYFMILIDATTRWSHACLLSTWNYVFAKIMAQVIRLKANFPEHRI
jgi:hypothetical protein